MTADIEKKRLDSAESGRGSNPSREWPSKLYIGAVIAAAVVHALMLITNGVFSVIMANTNASEFRNDSIDIVPAGWAFSIWGLIYFWNILFIIYCVVSLFPLRFIQLHKVPILVFPFYIANNLCNIVFIIIAEKFIYWLGVIVIIGLPVTLYVCIALCAASAYKQPCVKFFIFVNFVNNALAVYAGWTTVACLLYSGIALVHGGPGVDQNTAGTAMLAILLIEVVVFCPIEVTLLDKYMRHTWTHYIALIIALVGSMDKNYDPTNRNTVITVAISGVVTCAFLVKMCKMLFAMCMPDERHCSKVCPEDTIKKPLF